MRGLREDKTMTDISRGGEARDELPPANDGGLANPLAPEIDDSDWREIVDRAREANTASVLDRFNRGLIPRHDIGYELAQFEQRPIHEIVAEEKEKAARLSEESRSNEPHDRADLANEVASSERQDNAVAPSSEDREQDEASAPAQQRARAEEESDRSTPESSSEKDRKAVEHEHTSGVEMTEARRARFERLMNADFFDASQEITRGFDEGFERGGRE